MGILAKIAPQAAAKSDVYHKQLDALDLADIPTMTKLNIRTEFARLVQRHPGWKIHRAIRKAGEKFGILFDFKD